VISENPVKLRGKGGGAVSFEAPLVFGACRSFAGGVLGTCGFAMAGARLRPRDGRDQGSPVRHATHDGAVLHLPIDGSFLISSRAPSTHAVRPQERERSSRFRLRGNLLGAHPRGSRASAFASLGCPTYRRPWSLTLLHAPHQACQSVEELAGFRDAHADRITEERGTVWVRRSVPPAGLIGAARASLARLPQHRGGVGNGKAPCRGGECSREQPRGARYFVLSRSERN
jgi:hypothetical protein